MSLRSVSRCLGLLLLVAAGVVITGCGKKPQSYPPGFKVFTMDRLYVGTYYTDMPHPGPKVTGFVLWDLNPPVEYGWSSVTGSTIGFPWTKTWDYDGSFFLNNGREPAMWDSAVWWDIPCGMDLYGHLTFPVTWKPGQHPTEFNTILHWCAKYNWWGFGASAPVFATSDTAPSTITAPGEGLSSQFGMPTLYAYDRNLNITATAVASSVAADGSSATFPFPRKSDGTALPPDLYGYNVYNQTTADVQQCEPIYEDRCLPRGECYQEYVGDSCWTAPGDRVRAGINMLAIGYKDNRFTAPFGVDGVRSYGSTEECYPRDVWDPYTDSYQQEWDCQNWSWDDAYPIATLYYSDVLSVNGISIPVGSKPTAVKAYGVDTIYSYDEYSNTETTGPTKALVANTGSNSISVVDLTTNSVIATIPVGLQPTNIAITPDESKAYVTNFGSGTVSEINLATLSQSRVLSVGSSPSSIAINPDGVTAVVGGSGYIATVNLAPFAVSSSLPTSGIVTSVALATADNRVVYTAVASDGYRVSKINAQGSEAMAMVANEAYSFSSPLALSLPTPELVANGTIVSANYGRAITVSATSGGFVVYDNIQQREMMRGTTPTPVRSIGTNPENGVVYLALPESNTIITVPLPPSA